MRPKLWSWNKRMNIESTEHTQKVIQHPSSFRLLLSLSCPWENNTQLSSVKHTQSIQSRLTELQPLPLSLMNRIFNWTFSNPSNFLHTTNAGWENSQQISSKANIQLSSLVLFFIIRKFNSGGQQNMIKIHKAYFWLTLEHDN